MAQGTGRKKRRQKRLFAPQNPSYIEILNEVAVDNNSRRRFTSTGENSFFTQCSFCVKNIGDILLNPIGEILAVRDNQKLEHKEMAYWGAGRFPDLESVASGSMSDPDPSSRVFRKCVSFDSMDENGWTALHWAAATNNADVARALIECGGGVFLETRTRKKVEFNGMFIWASLTPLHIAAVAGSLVVAQILVEAGANVNALDNLSGTPLDAAMFWGHLDVAQLLVNAGARGKSSPSIDMWGIGSSSPLSAPLSAPLSLPSLPGTPIRNDQILNEPTSVFGNRYLQRDLGDNRSLSFTSGLLNSALLGTSPPYSDMLIGMAKDDSLLRDEGQKTPIAVLDMDRLVACQADIQTLIPGRDQASSLLPRSSFTDWVPQPEPQRKMPTTTATRFPGIRAPDAMVEPPAIPCLPHQMELFISARENNCERVVQLLGEGHDVQAVDKNGWTLLHWAAAADAAEAAQVLIQRGAFVDGQTVGEVDFNGRVWVGSTPLHVAANFGFLKVAQVLLHAGANVELCDCTGGTPLHSSAYWGTGDVAQALIEHGANVMAMTKGLSSPLHHASRSGHEVLADILIRAGANVNAQNSTKQTPLHLAALAGHVVLVEVLTSYGADKSIKNKKAKTPLQCICRGMDISPFAMLDLPGTKAKLRSLLG